MRKCLSYLVAKHVSGGMNLVNMTAGVEGILHRYLKNQLLMMIFSMHSFRSLVQVAGVESGLTSFKSDLIGDCILYRVWSPFLVYRSRVVGNRISLAN